MHQSKIGIFGTGSIYVEEKIALPDLESMPPFNRISGPIGPGKYKVNVTAYKFERGENDLELVFVGQTSSRLPFEFLIEED
jgi:hypothetical protein